MSKVAIIVGGLAFAGAGGALWYFWPQITETIHPPPREKGWFQDFLGWIMGDEFVDSASAIIGLPALMIKMMETVVIVGTVLISVLVLVFAYRMFQGNTPDLAGSIATVANSLPTAQMAQAMTKR
jgi:hypothetical protein